MAGKEENQTPMHTDDYERGWFQSSRGEPNTP
jgi:hypothetical protein